MMGTEACALGMAGMGLVTLLLVTALLLGIAALGKYLFTTQKHQEDGADNPERAVSHNG